MDGSPALTAIPPDDVVERTVVDVSRTRRPDAGPGSVLAYYVQKFREVSHGRPHVDRTE